MLREKHAAAPAREQARHEEQERRVNEASRLSSILGAFIPGCLQHRTNAMSRRVDLTIPRVTCIEVIAAPRRRGFSRSRIELSRGDGPSGRMTRSTSLRMRLDARRSPPHPAGASLRY